MFVRLHSFLQKIKFNKVLPVFLAVVLMFCSPLLTYAAFIQPTFAVEIHNYENNPEDIEYGSGAVLMKTSTGATPYLKFDVIIPANLLTTEDDYLTFNFVCHTSVESNTSTMYGGITFFDRYGNSLNSEFSLNSKSHNKAAYQFSVSTNNLALGLSNTKDLARARVWFSWPTDVSRFETCLMTIGGRVLSVDGSYSDVVASIQNQTDTIMNAGSGYGGTTSGIQSGNEALSGYIDQYTEIEHSMHDKFIETQTALNGEFTGFSWGSLSTCLNWVSDYLQQIYLNSGDFKMMITLPLLLGIALFLIGRGSLVYGEMTRDKSMDNKDFTLKD